VLTAEGMSTTFILKQSVVFLYDGWNMIAEIDTTTTARLIRSYEWGTDLSGTMDGAGGVGGLLVLRTHPSTINSQPSTGAHAPTYDGNGNVMELVNFATGGVSARYEYGAFGETISVDGDAIADANPIRFSTKYLDGETGLLYYTHRYYDPVNGRWLSRDPIGERGGVNMYAMLANVALNEVDVLGLVGGGGIGGPQWVPPSAPQNSSNNQNNGDSAAEYIYDLESLGILHALLASWPVYPTAHACLARYLNKTGGVMGLDANTHSKLHKNEKFDRIYKDALGEIIVTSFYGKQGTFSVNLEGTNPRTVSFSPYDGDLFYAFHNIQLKPRAKGTLCISGTTWTFKGLLGAEVWDNYNFSDPSKGSRKPLASQDWILDRYQFMTEDRFLRLEKRGWVKPFDIKSRYLYKGTASGTMLLGRSSNYELSNY
jgi:RHS repeat-associated protein